MREPAFVKRRRLLPALAEAQNWRCCWCGFRMIRNRDVMPEVRAILGDGGRRPHLLRMAVLRSASVEHVVPRCDGGTDEPGNLVVSCRCCNEFRSNHPAEFAAARIARMLRRGTHPHQVWERERVIVEVNPLPTIHRAPTPAADAMEAAHA